MLANEPEPEENPSTMCRKKILNRGTGWTAKMIDVLLGSPDKVQANPFYKKAPPMKLFLSARVEAAERTHEFERMAASAAARRNIAKKVAEDAAAELLDSINRYEIKINYMDFETLLKEAFDGRDSIEDATIDTKLRLCLSYIRHELTEYHEIIEALQHQFGTPTAYNRLRERIREEALRMYPQLAQWDAQVDEINFYQERRAAR